MQIIVTMKWSVKQDKVCIKMIGIDRKKYTKMVGQKDYTKTIAHLKNIE